MGKNGGKSMEENNRTAMDFYREYRGMNISELAAASGVSRQTVGMACRGELKLGGKRLRMLANALCVDPEDLDQDQDLAKVPETVVNIPAELTRISDAIARCKPKDIRRKIDNIVAYLGQQDEDVQNILTYLLQSSNDLGKIMAGYQVGKLYSHAYYYENYHPKIEVGYYAENEAEGEYKAFILFEDWVYDVFGMENPVCEMQIPAEDGVTTRTVRGLDFCIDIQCKEDDDFESELISQIIEYLWDYEVSELHNPKLVSLFEDFTDDIYGYATVNEYTCEGYDPLIPYRLKKREEDYTKLLFQILQQEGNVDAALKRAARIFSQINTLEDGEKKVFADYGLGETAEE